MVNGLTTSKSNGDANLKRFYEMWLCGYITITILKFVSPEEKTTVPSPMGSPTPNHVTTTAEIASKPNEPNEVGVVE